MVAGALSQAATTAIQQSGATRARHAIGVLTIATALTPDDRVATAAPAGTAVGWRGCCLFFAELQVLLSAPLNAFAVPRRSRQRASRPQQDFDPSPASATDIRLASCGEFDSGGISSDIAAASIHGIDPCRT